jgi:hypothetical protein
MESVMEHAIPFCQVLEAIGKLSLDEQQTLLEIVAKRMTEESRKKILGDIEEAKREFSEGRCEPSTPQKIMDDILS